MRFLRSRLARAAAALAVLLPAIALAPGCDVRDEPVRSGAVDPLWPRIAEEAAARRDLPRSATHSRPSIEYVEGYAAGQRQAASQSLPMLLVFRASWCRWSSELMQGALGDRGVVSLARRCVCVTVDADRDAATCKSFGVSSFPTVVVLDAGGRERFRATGSSAAGGLTTALRAVLDDAASPERIAGDIDDVQQR